MVLKKSLQFHGVLSQDEIMRGVDARRSAVDARAGSRRWPHHGRGDKGFDTAEFRG